MLVIRMQRTGRKGHAMFRVVVQDSRRTPTSGKIVAALGSYDPHSKTLTINKEKASFYLEHGAQPSDRVARLLKAEGVKLPGWVKLEANKERTVRNADKRRSTRPDEPIEEAPAAEASLEEAVAEPEASNEEAEKVVEASETAEANDSASEEVEAEAEAIATELVKEEIAEVEQAQEAVVEKEAEEIVAEDEAEAKSADTPAEEQAESEEKPAEEETPEKSDKDA